MPKLPPQLSKGPLPRAPLSEGQIEKLLGVAMSRGADFAEVYVERTERTSASLEDQKIKSASFGIDQGVGIRVISGAKVGYAYSDDLDDGALARAALTAAHIAASPQEVAPVNLHPVSTPSHYKVHNPLAGQAVERKIPFLLRGDAAARGFDPRVAQVLGAYVDQTKAIAVGNTEGHFARDVQDLCRLHFYVVAVGEGGERRTGFYGGGGRVDLHFFDTFTPEDAAREAARQAVETMGAIDAPAGPTTVVLAPGWSGILLHEAIGHGLEADFIRKETSLFTGQLGKQVASDKVTVIDDGTVAGNRGSINVDDEGVAGERKVLIENGILRGYMSDKLNAKLMGTRSTGSGRRESFRAPPMPRMTNTYLAPGLDSPEDIVRSVKRGVYCAHFGGGQVDISNGNFVFEVAEAYLIEDGKITAPLKNATLIGVGPEVLKNVSRVGNDPTPDPGIGTCGKDGQSVPVGVGLPTIRIENVTVGGTSVGGGVMKERKLAEQIVERAKKAGATQADAWLELGRESSVRVRDGDVEDLTQATSRGIGLRVIVDKRLGFAYGSDLSEAGLAILAERAVALAKAAAPDDANVLPTAAELKMRNAAEAVSPTLFDPQVVELSTEWKIDAAKAMEKVGRAIDKRVSRFESVGAADYVSQMAFASSEGVSDGYQSTYVVLYSAPVGQDANGQLQVGSFSDQKRFLADLMAPEEIGRLAAERAVRMLGAKKGPTARMPVVFEPQIGASFFGGLIGALDGNMVLKGASFLRDKLGVAIAPTWLSLEDDALFARGLGSSPFDGEGLATRKQPLLEAGVLKTFLYDTTTAHKAKALSSHTASRGYRSLPGIGTTTVAVRAERTVPKADLFKGIRRGLYVTAMLGRGADAVTGDYSRGANGLLIEDGALAGPVQEMTVAGNLLTMLGALESVGDDLEFHGALGSPSLRFSELTVAGG